MIKINADILMDINIKNSPITQQSNGVSSSYRKNKIVMGELKILSQNLT